MVESPKPNILIVLKMLDKNPDKKIESDNVGGDKIGGDKIGRDKYVYNFRDDQSNREQPSLILNDAHVINIDHRKDGSGEHLLNFRLVLDIENDSQIWVEQATIGIIYYAVKISGEKRIAESLKKNIEFDLTCVNTRNLSYVLQQQKLCLNSSGFEPYELRNCIVQNLAIYLSPDVQYRIPYEWKTALYLVAKNTVTTWYQVSMIISEELLPLIRKNNQKKADSKISTKYLKKERCDQEKPVVGLSLL